jgi:hypothetical protein
VGTGVGKALGAGDGWPMTSVGAGDGDSVGYGVGDCGVGGTERQRVQPRCLALGDTEWSHTSVGCAVGSAVGEGVGARVGVEVGACAGGHDQDLPMPDKDN